MQVQMDLQSVFDAQIAVPPEVIQLFLDFDEVWKQPQEIWIPEYRKLADKYGVEFRTTACPLFETRLITPN